MRHRMGAAAAAAIAVVAGPTSATNAWAAVSAPSKPALTEAAFLHTVNPRLTANVVTSNLTFFAGTHVAYECEIQHVVQAGVAQGDCGTSEEPVSLFIHLPTGRLHEGDNVRVVGYMENPIPWTSVTGRTVYYAFVKALFVDRLPAGDHS